jgi:hypothetical protein
MTSQWIRHPHARWGEFASTRAPQIVAAMLVVATLLSLVMAVAAPINDRPELWRGPPDEYGHRAAARYYIDHWLPPRVGDAATLDSYSRDYGFSYVNDTDPAYFLAGKFAALVSPVIRSPDRALRIFNVFLLAVLAGLCLARPAACLVFLPLALSPQIWYVFSYFNGDAWALFVSMLIAHQVAAPDTLFNRYLSSPPSWSTVLGALWLALLVGLLAISKKNFLCFLSFIPAAIALVHLGPWLAVLAAIAGPLGVALLLDWFRMGTDAGWAVAAVAAALFVLAILWPAASRGARATVVGKLAAIALVAVATAMVRPYIDTVIHGSLEQKQSAVIELQEKLARPEYRPSSIYAPQSGGHYGIELRARGTPLSALFAPPWNWPGRTFASATGLYGWLEFGADIRYHVLLALGYLAIAAVWFWSVVRSRDAVAGLGFLMVAAFSALTVGVALLHSWYHDFQAQGRYLFPIAPLLGVGLLLARAWIPVGALTAAGVACFTLSLYSFVFFGLMLVPKAF